MIDYLFMLIVQLLGMFAVFVSCNVACEYRNYAMGHKFITAFYADSSFQKLFTILQRKTDINNWDIGKITHIGYIVAIICTLTGVFVFPFSFILFFFNRGIAVTIYSYWCGGCFGLGVLVVILQILDSCFNYLIRVFKH